MRVQFERREELAPSIWQYFFRPERPVDFVPGQYASFHMPEPLNDPRGQARTFTLTSLPSDELLSFVVKVISPISPYKHVLQALESGAAATIDDAMGDLVLPKSPDQPLVFIAGGIGIASFVGMIKLLLAEREERQIFLFYQVRNRREQLFRDLLGAYPLALKHVTIAPHLLSADEIAGAVPSDSLLYVSGSQQFVETMRTDLMALGAAREQIVFDYYDGYAELE